MRDASDIEFHIAVDRGAFPRQAWGFRSFLRLVYMVRRSQGRSRALAELVTRMAAFDDGDAAGQAYFRQVHHTALEAWLTILEGAGAQRGEREFAAFLGEHPEFLDRDYLRRHYSLRRLRSAEARARPLPPDRDPLPLPDELVPGKADATSLARLEVRDRWRDTAEALRTSAWFATLVVGGLGVGGAARVLGAPKLPTLVLGPLVLAVVAAAPDSEISRDAPRRILDQIRLGMILVAAFGFQWTLTGLGWLLGAAGPALYGFLLLAPSLVILVLGSGRGGATRSAPPARAPAEAVHVLAVTEHAPVHADAACPFCGDPLGRAAVRACPRCETPHHADCWAAGGGCTTFGCEASR